MPGRLPTAVKRLKGTLEPSRVNPHEPQPTAIDRPPAPADLDVAAAAAWDRLAACVAHLRCLTGSDLELLRAASVALARSERVNRDPKSSVNQQLRAESHLLSMLKELGLTPVARSRVSAAPERDETRDRLAKFAVYPGKGNAR